MPAGPSSITATYVVLVGFQLPDPNQSSMAFVPTGLAATADASVVLQDVRILVDSNTLQQHLQYIARQTNVTHYTVSWIDWLSVQKCTLYTSSEQQQTTGNSNMWAWFLVCHCCSSLLPSMECSSARRADAGDN